MQDNWAVLTQVQLLLHTALRSGKGSKLTDCGLLSHLASLCMAWNLGTTAAKHGQIQFL